MSLVLAKIHAPRPKEDFGVADGEERCAGAGSSSPGGADPAVSVLHPAVVVLPLFCRRSKHRTVISPFLESTLLGACPGLRDSWDAHRRTFGAGEEPDEQALFDAVRRHVVELLVAGRVAEFSRFARTMERLFGEADPMLYELLREELLRPLARDVQDAGIPHARVAPYLGVRLGLAWPER